MKTSTVRTVVGEPRLYEKNMVYYHNLEMDNGDKINIGKKKVLDVGAELTYELIGDPGQHEFTKAKSVQQDPTYQTGSSNDKGRIILLQTCLKASAEFHAQRSGADFDKVVEEAIKAANRLENA